MGRMPRAAVFGAGGFIGSHLTRRLKQEGYWVRGADLVRPAFAPSAADEFLLADLRQAEATAAALEGVDEVYQLAADMGGAGYLFTGEHDVEVVANSVTINLHTIEQGRRAGVGRYFFSSSACVYPEHNQADPANPVCTEDSVYPAQPDSEYGWEKLFSERLYLSAARQYGLDARIGRFHNVFGPEGTWTGGREKAPAAICRKVAEASDGGQIEIWGDGEQTRSFLYVDECVEAVRRLMASTFTGPVNIGSDELISVNALAALVMELAGKRLTLRHVPGPQGVRGRRSDNRLIDARLGWKPSAPLADGLSRTYRWIAAQVAAARG